MLLKILVIFYLSAAVFVLGRPGNHADPPPPPPDGPPPPPPPPFLQNATEDARRAFFQIIDNKNLTQNEIDAQVSEWAKTNNVSEEYDEFKQNKTAFDKEIKTNVSTIIENLDSVNTRLNSIFSNKSQTRDQVEVVVDALRKEFPVEVDIIMDLTHPKSGEHGGPPPPLPPHGGPPPPPPHGGPPPPPPHGGPPPPPPHGGPPPPPPHGGPPPPPPQGGPPPPPPHGGPPPPPPPHGGPPPPPPPHGGPPPPPPHGGPPPPPPPFLQNVTDDAREEYFDIVNNRNLTQDEIDTQTSAWATTNGVSSEYKDFQKNKTSLDGEIRSNASTIIRNLDEVNKKLISVLNNVDETGYEIETAVEALRKEYPIEVDTIIHLTHRRPPPPQPPHGGQEESDDLKGASSSTSASERKKKSGKSNASNSQI